MNLTELKSYFIRFSVNLTNGFFLKLTVVSARIRPFFIDIIIKHNLLLIIWYFIIYCPHSQVPQSRSAL